MRPKLFAALLAAFAVAALGVGPAVASAGTVELTQKKGKVEKGSAVSVKSSVLIFEGMSGGKGECEPGGILNGERLPAAPDAATVGGFFSGKAPKCFIETWGGQKAPLSIAYFVPSSINFVYGGTGTMPIKYGLVFGEGEGAYTCGYEGTLSVTWTSGSSTFYITGKTARTSGGVACALNMTLSGNMSLFDTSNPEEAISIVGTP